MKRKKKDIREKGKLKLSRMFQELKEGDKVIIVKELSIKANFPNRIQGRVGIVEGKRGKAYIIRIPGKRKDKIYIIEPIHLKKLK